MASVTAALRQKDHPLRQLVDETLPNVKAVRVAIPHRVTVPPRTLHAGTVGTAFDYRLRFLWGLPDDPGSLIARRGAQMLCDRRTPKRYTPVDDTSEIVAGAIRPHLRGSTIVWRHPDDVAAADLWPAITTGLGMVTDPRATGGDLERLCVVLAWCDEAARSALVRNNPLLAAPEAATTRQLLDMVSDDGAAEVAALTDLFLEHHGHLLDQPIDVNPTFGRPALPADGDLIVDRCLIEVKTSREPVTQTDVWQLATYLLLERQDRFDSVAFYCGRSGILRRWTNDEYLELLAGRPVDLAELRARLDERCPPTGRPNGTKPSSNRPRIRLRFRPE